MQTVDRSEQNQLKIFDEIDRLYGLLSCYQSPNGIPELLDKRVYPIVEKFNRYSETVWQFDYNERPVVPTTQPSGDTIVLCFSGGRDSIVSLMKYRAEGRDVILYHVHGINASQSDEIRAAEECARYFNVPLITNTIHYHGHNVWMEHPMKNIIIAGSALNYTLGNHLGYNIAFGNYSDSELCGVPFHVCAGDCIDMWEAYEGVLNEDLPDFKVGLNLKNLGETMDYICGNDEVLDMSISCSCRHSLRDYRRQWVKDKFGVVLPKHRCGSCAKCTAEYIYRADHGQTPLSEAYYMYCIDNLYKVILRGEAGNWDILTVEDVFNTFLFYPVEQSRMYEQIQNARLRSASIEW